MHFFWHLIHNLWQKILQGLIEHTYDKIISILVTHSSLSISCLTLELFSSALIVELIYQVFGVCSFLDRHPHVRSPSAWRSLDSTRGICSVFVKKAFSLLFVKRKSIKRPLFPFFLSPPLLH